MVLRYCIFDGRSFSWESESIRDTCKLHLRGPPVWHAKNSSKTANFRRTTCISHLPFLQAYVDASVESPRFGIRGVADFLLLTDFRINSRASHKMWGDWLTSSNHRTSYINRLLNMQDNKLTMIEGSSIKCQVLLWLSVQNSLDWDLRVVLTHRRFCNVFFWEIAFEPREEHRQQANVKTILNKATHSIGGYHGLKTFLNFQMLVLAVLIIYLQRRWRVTPFLHQILNRNCCANSYHHWVTSPCIFSTS